MTGHTLVAIVVGQVGGTPALFGSCVENQIAGTTQTLFLVLVVVGVLGAGQTSSVLEERSIGWAALALLSLGIVDLSISTSSTSSIDDKRSRLRAFAFVACAVVHESLGARMA